MQSRISTPVPVAHVSNAKVAAFIYYTTTGMETGTYVQDGLNV